MFVCGLFCAWYMLMSGQYNYLKFEFALLFPSETPIVLTLCQKPTVFCPERVRSGWPHRPTSVSAASGEAGGTAGAVCLELQEEVTSLKFHFHFILWWIFFLAFFS